MIPFAASACTNWACEQACVVIIILAVDDIIVMAIGIIFCVIIAQEILQIEFSVKDKLLHHKTQNVRKVYLLLITEQEIMLYWLGISLSSIAFDY